MGSMRRLMTAVIGLGIAPLLITACGSDAEHPGSPSHKQGKHHSQQTAPGYENWHTPANPGDGYWDEQGNPVDGGPRGANGSFGNDLTKEYCAQNEDPGCPVGSYVGPDAILDPAGGNDYVPCEGTICTNPNHGAGEDPECEGTICTNPNHGAGEDPECEGTICTNPNHGAGEDPECEGTICTNPNHGAGDEDDSGTWDSTDDDSDAA
ncbi:hypothetical protein AWC30_16920 [Mycolicibacillus trivialis]|uniref:Lipoprotein n=1 Tax=Mycolicibacillus trivialis TaxID=1798 RepID=A0A1X2EEB9_9MYCO|nr:hypothetical protein [Mycolicibacillus trivialis]ORW99201.1 hypothetical protein AWC30_16920 [Mycolicibacillus trivialis]